MLEYQNLEKKMDKALCTYVSLYLFSLYISR